jgi:hypothetical protein
MDPVEYDVFISYSRADNTGGWVSGLRDAVYEDFRAFSSEPFRIFLRYECDSQSPGLAEAIAGRPDDLPGAAGVLVAELSAQSALPLGVGGVRRGTGPPCGGGDPVTGVYFVDLGASSTTRPSPIALRTFAAMDL